MPFDFARHCCAHMEEIAKWKSTVTFRVGAVSVTVPLMSLPCAVASFDALRAGRCGDNTSSKERAEREYVSVLARLVEAASQVVALAAEPDCPYSVSIVTHDTGGAA